MAESRRNPRRNARLLYISGRVASCVRDVGQARGIVIRKTRIPALACTCDVCSYRWVSINKKEPEFCPNRECRSREWNGPKKRVVKPKTRIELPKPIKIRGGESDEF